MRRHDVEQPLERNDIDGGRVGWLVPEVCIKVRFEV